MNTKEIAESLNGLGYREDPQKGILDSAKDAGIIIVVGASDDLMEIYGATREEVGCYGGGVAYFTDQGLVKNLCDDDRCPYAAKEKERAVPVEALWCKEDVYIWTYKTEIPHETFDVLEDGEPYCRGIVFKLSDIKLKT